MSGHDIKTLVKCIICSYLISTVLLLLLALMVYKFDLDENKAYAGINITYILSSLTGGFIIGKVKKERKYMWGAVCALLYFAILILVSLAVNQSVITGVQGILTTGAICMGAGAIGGMLA